MSIRIDKEKCIGCGRCIEACPGNLLKKDQNGKAFILHMRDCWGCTSCLKECKSSAIRFFLGADIGGRGSALSVDIVGDRYLWQVTDSAGKVRSIEVNKKEANK